MWIVNLTFSLTKYIIICYKLFNQLQVGSISKLVRWSVCWSICLLVGHQNAWKPERLK